MNFVMSCGHSSRVHKLDSKRLPIALFIILLVIYLLAIFKNLVDFFQLRIVNGSTCFYIEQKFYKLF